MWFKKKSLNRNDKGGIVARVRRIYHLLLGPPYTCPPGGAKWAATPSIRRRLINLTTGIPQAKEDYISLLKSVATSPWENDMHMPHFLIWKYEWYECWCHAIRLTPGARRYPGQRVWNMLPKTVQGDQAPVTLKRPRSSSLWNIKATDSENLPTASSVIT